uniref:PUB domain-containing protein n=1 Tax=Syphacia muris TaxID=451379 RepID=A0A0N5A902_9BILA
MIRTERFNAENLTVMRVANLIRTYSSILKNNQIVFNSLNDELCLSTDCRNENVFLTTAKLETYYDKHATLDEVNKINSNKPDQKHGGLDTDDYAKACKSSLDKKLLKVKHREQLSAVQNVMAVESKKKQKKLLTDLLANMLKVVKAAKVTIESAGFKPTDPFPEKNIKLRDAVANVVENTAFFCEFVLRFPDFIGKLYELSFIIRFKLKGNKELSSLTHWGYEFSSSAKLFDEAEERLLSLAAQQLNIIPREENFRNPYDKKIQKEEIEREAVRKMEEVREKRRADKEKERKNKKKERKPSLSKAEL